MTVLFTEQLQQILANNYDDPDFDYSRLCEELGLSRSQVYRQFQEENLGSPSNYLRIFRLEKAKELLINTDLLIFEIALDVGFKSASHFSTNFFNFYDISPRMYRKEIEK